MPRGTAACISTDGTTKFINDGRNRRNKSPDPTSPSCQTINDVMSANGLNVPPALAATTMFMQDNATKHAVPRCQQLSRRRP